MYNPQEVAQRFAEALDAPVTGKDQAIGFWSATAESYGVAVQVGQQGLDALKGLEGQLPQGMEEMEINPEALKFHQHYVDYYSAFVSRVHEILVFLKGQVMPKGGLGPVIKLGESEDGSMVGHPLLTVEDAIRFCEKVFPDANKPEDRVEGARYAAMAMRAKETARVLKEMGSDKPQTD